MTRIRLALRRPAAALTVAALLCAIGPVAADTDPPERPRPEQAERIRTGHLKFAATAAVAQPVAADAAPRAADVAERIRAAVDRVRRGGSERKAPAALRDRPARTAPLVTEVVDDAGGRAKVARERGSATPRQIRGGRLHRADGTGGTRAERDGITARRFLRERRDLLGIRDPDAEMRLERADVDSLGYGQVRFAQTWRGLDVWPSRLVVQLDAQGDVDMLSGAFVRTPRRIVTRPTLSAAKATAKARRAVPGSDGAQVADPELIVYAGRSSLPRLAWKTEVTISEGERWLVVVDAHTGRTIESFDVVAHEDVTTTGVDLLGQTRTLHVWHEGGSYYLVDTSKSMYDPSSNPPQPNSTRGGIAILDALHDGPDPFPSLYFVNSANPASWSVRDGVSAAWGLSQTYDYFLSRHGRDAIDGEGGTMIGVVRLGNGFRNAFWNGHLMAFGDGEPYAASIDVVAHELAHGVTEKTAELVYRGQSGAINEAMSDIFGEMVEAAATGGNDWKIGTELGSHLRDMRNPGSLTTSFGAYPARMSQFINTSQDNGGVHLNSSIINHAYYQLAEGLPNAVGRADAERIFYRTLTTKLVAESRFVDCRLGAVAAAEEIFGGGSTQARATADAFDEVEILGAAATPAPTPAPAVDALDSAICVFYHPGVDRTLLARREAALGDPSQGTTLVTTQVMASRPSVTGDGRLAVYVDGTQDVCLVTTDGIGDPACVGASGTVHSVAMSPDGSKFAFVLLDALGDPDNTITVVDLEDDTQRTFPLVAPLIDGGTIEVLQADAMSFSRDGNLLVYDGFNVVRFADGSQIGLWSIYGLDLATESVFSVVEPTVGYDIFDPALAHTTGRYLAFEVYDPDANVSTAMVRDVFTGDISAVVNVPNPTVTAMPCFTGDDLAIVVTAPDATNTGTSLFRQGLSADHMTPSGSPALWLEDASFGVVYRRGDVPPAPPPASFDVEFESGAPRIEEIDLEPAVNGVPVPVHLTLRHAPNGKFVANGTCTVGGDPVNVTGRLSFNHRAPDRASYSLVLTSPVPRRRVTLRATVTSPTVKVGFSGPEGRGTGTIDVDVFGSYPTSRLTLSPQLGLFGRIGGTGTLLAGFGSDDGLVGRLSGRIRDNSRRARNDTIKLTYVETLTRRRIVLSATDFGDTFVGGATYKVPPVTGKDTSVSFPDVFGN